MKLSDFLIGIGLVILGVIFLFDNFGYVRVEFWRIWPVLVILGGLGFWVGFFRNREDYGLIMPGTILVIYGLMFFYCAIAGWWHMEHVWPGFMIGPGIGFFLMYLLGPKEKGLLIPAGILTGIGLVFMFQRTSLLRYWPVVLIIIGVVLILKYTRDKKEE